MRKESSKRSSLNKKRSAFTRQILAERSWCEACPVFAKHDEKVTYLRNPACDVHEIVRRSQGGSIIDEENVLAVCRPCHDRIGRYPALAFELGLAKRGNTGDL